MVMIGSIASPAIVIGIVTTVTMLVAAIVWHILLVVVRVVV